MGIQAQAQQVELSGGAAEYMGDGVWTICQKDEFGAAQSVVLPEEDLRSLLGTLVQDVELSDGGQATHMGEGAFVVQQKDEYGTVHSVYLSAEDLQCLLGVEG